MAESITLAEQRQMRKIGKALEYMLDEKGRIRHTFWGLLRYLQMNHSCYMPGPAVFANQDARRIIASLTDKQVADLLEQITTKQISREEDFQWYGLFNILIEDRPKDLYQSTDAYRMVCMVNEMYEILTKKYCWNRDHALDEVHEMVCNEGACWLDLKSAST